MAKFVTCLHNFSQTFFYVFFANGASHALRLASQRAQNPTACLLPETASNHAKQCFRHAEKFCRAVADKGLKDCGLQAAFGRLCIDSCCHQHSACQVATHVAEPSPQTRAAKSRCNRPPLYPPPATARLTISSHASRQPMRGNRHACWRQ